MDDGGGVSLRKERTCVMDLDPTGTKEQMHRVRHVIAMSQTTGLVTLSNKYWDGCDSELALDL